MGIYKQLDRHGKTRYVVSKYWPGNAGRIRYYAPNLAVAKQLIARIDQACLLGTWRDLRDELSGKIKPTETLKNFSERFMAVKGKSRLKIATRLNYQKTLNRICQTFGEVPINRFGVNEMNLLMEMRGQEGVKPGTINNFIIVLKSLFSFAVEVGALTEHPLARFKMLKMQRKSNYPLSQEEVERLIQAQRTTIHRNLYRATMWHRMGLEVKSVSALLGHADISTTNRYLVISKDLLERVIEAQEAEKRGLTGNKQATVNG